jgi:hypothetical protein
MLRTSLLIAIAVLPAVASANDYRGMPAGWPLTNAGVAAVPVTAGYAPAAAGGQAYGLYYANRPSYAAPLAYYATRPVQPTTAGYITPTVGMAPSYAPVNYTQPVQTFYAPPAYGAAPVTAYSPVAAATAPAYGVAPPPGTMLQQQRVTYGTAGAIGFAPPAMPVHYRAYYAPAAGAVTYYRPVTVYQPVTGQPVTCLQAVAAPTTCGMAPTTCGTAPCAPATCGSSGCGSSWWRNCGLFNWFCNRCSGNSCTTGYCGTSSCAPTGCGQQPYYPVVPVNPIPSTPIITQPAIPVVPAPSTTNPIIRTPTVPPPPTRIPMTGVPADSAPSLAPGSLPSTGSTIIRPSPSTTIVPGATTPGTITTPGTTIVPGTTSPYIPPTGSTPATEYYPPAPAEGSRFDSNRFSPPSIENGESQGSLRFSPPANQPPGGVKVIPDPEAPSVYKPTNRAPQLINPQDRSAAAIDYRWAVVPAVWPTKQVARVSPPNEQPQAGGRVVHVAHPNNSRQLDERTNFTPTSAFVPQTAELDDSGWASGQ